mgnify:CR=1 FL=1
MKLKRLISLLLLSVYLLAMKEQSLARCCKLLYGVLSERAANLVMRGTRRTDEIFSGTASLKATCCGNHHSTEINLYTFSQDSEKSTRCTVTDLPPALVAEAPEPADISLGGEKTVGRCAPFVERGHVRCAGLRAPPVLA